MDTARLILRREDIANMHGEDRVHFLNPNAVWNRKSLGDLTGLEHLGVHIPGIEGSDQANLLYLQKIKLDMVPG